jgi:hypothetical protein
MSAAAIAVQCVKPTQSISLIATIECRRVSMYGTSAFSFAARYDGGMKQKPQISIRSLLLITAILAIAIGWLADRQRLSNQLHEAATKDLLQRQQIFAMQQELQQFEANAAKPVDYSWKFPALKKNFPATQSSASVR